MLEKQPTTTEQSTAERHNVLRENWESTEIPANTPVTLNAEHTTSDTPEVAAFHLGSKDALAENQDKGALYQVVDTSKLERVGDYFKYDGYLFDASQGGDFLIVSSPNDGSETRRGGADAKPENFTYQFVSKGGQLEVGRDSNSDLTPDVDTISRQHLKLDVDDDGNLSFIDLDSTNGTTLHTPEDAVTVTGDPLEQTPSDDEVDDDTDPGKAIDNEPDAEIRHNDAELLRQRDLFVQAIRTVGNQRIRAIESAQASWKNTLDTPAKMAYGLRTSLMEGRVARHQRLVDETKEGSWVHQRRLKKLQKLQAKRDRLKGKYEAISGRMKNRREAVSKGYEERKNNSLKELKGRAELARSRKALRHELKGQGAGLIERRLAVRNVIKNHPNVILDAMGDASNIAALRGRELKQAERAQDRVHKNHDQTKESIRTTAQRSSEFTATVEKATKRRGELSEEMAKTTEKIEELTAEREELSEQDARRFAAGIELREAERTLEEQTTEMEELERSIDYHTAAIDQFAAEQARLAEQAQAEEAALAAARENTDARRQAAEDAIQAQQAAARKAVTTQLPTKEKK